MYFKCITFLLVHIWMLKTDFKICASLHYQTANKWCSNFTFPKQFCVRSVWIKHVPKAVLRFNLARWISCVESFIMENFSDIPWSMQIRVVHWQISAFESLLACLFYLRNKCKSNCIAKEVKVKVASQFLSWYQVSIRGLEFATDNKRTGLNLNTQVWF